MRVAIVGEFNAGKSTFINAVIGADVAPTGVLPTTATLHHLRYAPDPFARIQFHADAPSEVKERIVPSSELRAALKGGDAEWVKRVEILQPIASLTRVEILDTPGFNAPDTRHTEAARSAFEEADAAIWLLDAGQPLKQTERRILDEAKVTSLPVQILVNKADRLKPEDLATVMTSVGASLEETGIRSWAEPLALSARLALQGKLGDEDALARSGWEHVQRLLDEQIGGRRDELKEGGLRRRAGRVVTLMLERAREHAAEERAAIEAARARAQELALRAANLEREADEAAQVVAGAIGGAAADWKRDLEVVVTGRDRQQVANDPTLLRYRVDRAGPGDLGRRGRARRRSHARRPRGRPHLRRGERPGRRALPAHAERRRVADRAPPRARRRAAGARSRGGARRRARGRAARARRAGRLTGWRARGPTR
ncbi:MAG: dynamin family protein [Labilithrix sp.]|nr:dynamin family protein [Labilithrix sp.]